MILPVPFLRELNAHHSGIHGASDDHQVRPESTRIHLHVTGFSLYGIIVLRKGIRIKLILIVPGILFVVFTSRAICLV